MTKLSDIDPATPLDAVFFNPVSGTKGRSEFHEECWRKPLPPQSTDWAPGTVGKLLVMIARANAGYQVFHPMDCRHGDERTVKLVRKSYFVR